MKTVFRTHDNCDGDTRQGISVTMDPMGDIYISVRPGSLARSVRFRTPGGGTMSPNVHTALSNVIDAIDLDNKMRPFEAKAQTGEEVK